MKKYIFKEDDQHKGEFPQWIESIAHVCENPLWQFCFHRHLDKVDITFIKSGKGEYAIGNRWIPVSAGDLIILKPGVIHAIRSSEDNPIDLWILAFTQFDKALQIIEFNEDPFRHASAYYGNNQAAAAVGLLIESTAYQREIDNSRSYINHCLELSILNALTIFFSQSDIFPLVENNYVADGAIAFIDDHYSNQVSLATLSRVLHVSSSCISHEMSSYYSTSPIKSLINRRIGRAQWLLATTNMSFTNIARNVGYDNLTHFTNLFLKRAGMSHREFRDRFHEENQIKRQ